jgi:hypothetical protein
VRYDQKFTLVSVQSTGYPCQILMKLEFSVLRCVISVVLRNTISEYNFTYNKYMHVLSKTQHCCVFDGTCIYLLYVQLYSDIVQSMCHYVLVLCTGAGLLVPVHSIEM